MNTFARNDRPERCSSVVHSLDATAAARSAQPQEPPSAEAFTFAGSSNARTGHLGIEVPGCQFWSSNGALDAASPSKAKP